MDDLPDIELVAADVHAAYVQGRLEAGVTSRISPTTGKEQLVPYDQLEDEDKEQDRITVRTVYAAIRRHRGGQR